MWLEVIYKTAHYTKAGAYNSKTTVLKYRSKLKVKFKQKFLPKHQILAPKI